MSAGAQQILTNVVAYLIGINLLVAIHEFGHYWVARRVGIKVLRFSIGFGRVLWKRVGRDGVEYVLSAIPLGGYVKLLDEREGNVKPEDLPYAFGCQAYWKRITVLAAGPAFNFIFAVIAFWCVFMSDVIDIKPVIGTVKAGSIAANAGMRAQDTIVKVGGREVTGISRTVDLLVDQLINDKEIALSVQGADGVERPVSLLVHGKSNELTADSKLFEKLGFEFWMPTTLAVISKITPDGPAARAGLQSQDRVVQFDGVDVADFEQLSKLIRARPDRQVMIVVERKGATEEVNVTLGQSKEDGVVNGVMGIVVERPPLPESMKVIESASIPAAFVAALRETGSKVAFTFKLMWKLITGHVSVKSISGPIGIASAAGQVVHYGWVPVLAFLASISVVLGAMNLLPIPVLDGGQIVHQTVELLNRGPVSERAQVVFQQIGIVLLVLLTGLAIYNDITRHT